MEHILPNAIGGRLRSDRLLCEKCNSKFGETYEADFARQLSFFSGRLPIRRHRGKNPRFETTDRKTSRPIAIDSNGRISLARTIMLETPRASKGTLNFIAPDEAEAKKRLKRFCKKFPNAKLDIKNNPSAPIETEIMVSFDIAVLKTAQKCLLNFYIHSGGKRESIVEEAKRVFDSGSEPRIWFFPETYERPPETKLKHFVAIYGSPKDSLLYGYLDFFGAVQLIGVLNDQYDGPEVRSTHCIDPLNGQIETCEVNVEMSRQDILHLVKERPLDERALVARLGKVEGHIRTSQYFTNLTNEVFKKTILSPKNKGKLITQEMLEEMQAQLVEALMPNILEASRRRREEAEKQFRKEHGLDEPK